MLIDSHCHVHDDEVFNLDREATLERARAAGVGQIICIGTTAVDSRQAIDFASSHSQVFATVGLHPHDSKLGDDELAQLEELVNSPRVVAVGECGLDYYYENSPRARQQLALRHQINLALDHDLPVVFHVRDAFGDFFKIVDEYQSGSRIRGVVHSFSTGPDELKGVLARGFYVGLNGIMTFAKDTHQLAAAKSVPLDRLLLETDSPFLTPVPFRGKINEPAYVRQIAEFLASLRGESVAQLAKSTTTNAQKLFNIAL
ncbi:TatD family hydrolase [Candidatus Microgenomates bacterium]|nr:TatD family hydrolase [Candidatus Microgenomates bacterium]